MSEKQTVTAGDVDNTILADIASQLKTQAELLAMQPVEFHPTADFWSEEFKSQYVKDLRYTINNDNEKLAAAVEGWLREGKVRIGRVKAAQSGEASAFGAGTIA